MIRLVGSIVHSSIFVFTLHPFILFCILFLSSGPETHIQLGTLSPALFPPSLFALAHGRSERWKESEKRRSQVGFTRRILFYLLGS